MLDHVGDEDEAGKTLGTDALRRKFTLAQSPGGDLKQHVHDLCTSAAGCVAAWPEASKAVHTYLVRDIGPVLQRLLGSKLAPWKEPVT